MDPYAELGLQPVINAAGALTYLGASVLDPEVADGVAAAARRFVDLPALAAQVGRRLAAATGAEAGLAVASAAAGIVTAIAACITGDDEGAVGLLPDWPSPRRKVVLPKAHAVSFGAPVTQMLRLAGAVPVEAGQVNRVSSAELDRAMADADVAAAFFVVSHHVGPEGSPDLPEFLRIARGRGVPVVVDAAAETDLRRYVAAGADLVVYSGHKAVRAPTSGILVGRVDLVRAACLHQNSGIGRAMKVGKEQMVGLALAVDRYVRRDVLGERARREGVIRVLEERLAPWYRTERTGEPDRGIPRLALVGTPSWAAGLVKALEDGIPSIRTRNHEVPIGRVTLDPRFLDDDELAVVVARLVALARAGTSQGGDAPRAPR